MTTERTILKTKSVFLKKKALLLILQAYKAAGKMVTYA